MTKPSTAIKKGKELENYVADQIKEKGLGNASRSIGSGSGTREKADIVTSLAIYGRNLGFECKNHSVAKVRDWFKQAQDLEKLGREPIVAYKLKGESYYETKCIIYLDTFLELVKSYYQLTDKVDDIKSEIEETTHYDKIDGVNKIDFAIKVLKEAKKKLAKDY